LQLVGDGFGSGVILLSVSCSRCSGRILFGVSHFIAGGGWLLDHCWRANSATRGADCWQIDGGARPVEFFVVEWGFIAGSAG
tara:strand:- start:1178 stop:1423 length:246 start_codon:yes stop_codon:yes gene_type:complete